MAEPLRQSQSQRGMVFVPKSFAWDRAISASDKEAIVEQVLRLPLWVDGRLEAQNLDVKKLGDGDLWRLRIGAHRAVFQLLGQNVVLHRIFRRRGDSDYRGMAQIPLVRSREGLRTLVEPPAEAERVPGTRRPVIRPARHEPVQNPLSVFADEELAAVGLSQKAVAELRRVPPELLPDPSLAHLGVEPGLIRFVAEIWERPGAYVGKELRNELVKLDQREAAERLLYEYSAMSLAPIDDPAAFLAVLDGRIEEWMIYLHPSQRAAVRRPAVGPSRVRGGAGTGKTVVALHRARYLSDETGGEVLLTTFVNTLPKVWKHLLASFPEHVGGRIRCRTVNQIARELYYAAGGQRRITSEGERRASIHDIWLRHRDRLRGLSELGLEEEFDHMIIGRGVEAFEVYAALPRTGRGTPLASAARAAVWDAYLEYSRQMGRARLTYWPELRRDALAVLRDGRATQRYDAVVADEAQDLGEASILMLVETAGGLPQPNLTLIGDGQQAIYPGGFSLLELGLDIRGRATVLRTNWRNTYAIWAAAQAFIQGEEFDDLEEEAGLTRDLDALPLPMRDGAAPGLWIAPDGEEAVLAAEVVREALELGSQPGDTAVLAPTNSQVERLRSALRSASVPAGELAHYEGMHQPLVKVGTFHRAKGLEFKHVVVTGLGAAQWPPRRPGLDPVAREEARARDVRAAFVAMSRARDRLDVVVAKQPADQLEQAAWTFDLY